MFPRHLGSMLVDGLPVGCACPALLNSQRAAPGFLPPRSWRQPPTRRPCSRRRHVHMRGVGGTRTPFVTLTVSRLDALLPGLQNEALGPGPVSWLSTDSEAGLAQPSALRHGSQAERSSPVGGAPLHCRAHRFSEHLLAAPSSLSLGSSSSVWPATTVEPRLSSQLTRSEVSKVLAPHTGAEERCP